MIDLSKPLSVDPQKLTEPEIRQLRDYVFERKLSDPSWQQVSHRWMVPTERAWLVRTATAMQTTRIPRK